MFDKQVLKSLGMITATIRHPLTAKRFETEFYITERDGPILGVNDCRRMDLIRINNENICEVTDVNEAAAMNTMQQLTENDIFVQFGDLFDRQLGLMEGEVHLELDPQAKPVQLPLRRLPLATRDKVELELSRMVRDGIIAPVTEPTRWVSALLTTMKPNGQIRICMDPTRTLNQYLFHANIGRYITQTNWCESVQYSRLQTCISYAETRSNFKSPVHLRDTVRQIPISTTSVWFVSVTGNLPSKNSCSVVRPRRRALHCR